MSDHDDPPTDLMDTVFRLDDIAEWLRDHDYHVEADRLQGISRDLKEYIVIRLDDR